MGAAEEKVAAFLRAGVVAAVAGVLRDAVGQPVETTAEALVDLFDRDAIVPLAGEVERMRAQVAELLPYAWAGADALDSWESRKTKCTCP